MELLRDNPFARAAIPVGRPARALVGAPEAWDRDALASELQREGYAVGEAADGMEMLAQLAVEPFDLVVIDPKLPGPTVLDALPPGHGGPKVIVLDRPARVSQVIARALKLVSPLQVETGG